ncbi:hypothetical protein D3C80_1838950 [compost metagenome]
MDIVTESGSGFAFPSQTVYFAQDEGVSEEKTKATSEKVKAWKENGELQVPRFHQDKIDEIEDSIVYPPEGSAISKKKE